MTVSEELEEICAANDGVLLPRHVVDYARNNLESELHKKFNWNIEEAAEQFWLQQARMIIRAEVTVIPGISEEVRTYVNLVHGRYDDGGYKPMITVLTNPTLLENLLDEAKKELEQWLTKYGHIIELAEVVAAIKTVNQRRVIKVPVEYGVVAEEF